MSADVEDGGVVLGTDVGEDLGVLELVLRGRVVEELLAYVVFEVL